MLQIIDSITTISVLASVVLLGKDLLQVLGGNIAFIVIIPIHYYISYIEKRAQLEMSLLNVLILLILGINYINNLDISRTYSESMLIVSYLILYILSLLVTCIIMTRTLNLRYYDNEGSTISIIRQNYKFIILYNLGISLCYAIVTCLVFLSFKNDNIPICNLFKMIPLSFVWMPIYLIIALCALRKINSRHFDCIFEKNEKPIKHINNIKVVYLTTMSIIFVLGSLIELYRSEWMLWVECFVAINSIILLFWTTYRHRISLNQCSVEADLGSITLLINSKYIIKIICINTVFITMFIVGLIVTISFCKWH